MNSKDKILSGMLDEVSGILEELLFEREDSRIRDAQKLIQKIKKDLFKAN